MPQYPEGEGPVIQHAPQEPTNLASKEQVEGTAGVAVVAGNKSEPERVEPEPERVPRHLRGIDIGLTR